MAEKRALTIALAIAGTVLVGLPVLAPVALSLAALGSFGVFHMDYLIPAELSPLAITGGVLLLWAALRARSRRALIAWSLGSAIVVPVVGQVLAMVTGLASGAREPTDWAWTLVLASLALYVLALVALVIGGVLLLRHLFRPGASPPRA
jgi:hypothetical protein